MGKILRGYLLKLLSEINTFIQRKIFTILNSFIKTKKQSKRLYFCEMKKNKLTLA